MGNSRNEKSLKCLPGLHFRIFICSPSIQLPNLFYDDLAKIYDSRHLLKVI